MYDAIIVGARCAGAPTALLLARKGYKVLLLDRGTFPSDMPFSNHFDYGAFSLTGSPVPAEDGVTEAFAPRRLKLDPILVDAAVKSGAELREGFSVQEVIFEDGRVAGIRGHEKNGPMVTEKARITVGADGMFSVVAKAVEAPEYKTGPALEGSWYAYFSGVPMVGWHLWLRPGNVIFAYNTNDNLSLIGVAFAARDLPTVRANIEKHHSSVIAQHAPELWERMQAGKRESRYVGGAIPSHVRKPYGPGWALVGDAGYQKDPCTASGITDAFGSAEWLAEAIDAGLSGRQPLEEALAAYEQTRNQAELPYFDLTTQLAALEPPPPEVQQLLEALRENPEQRSRFFGMLAHTVPVTEFFSPENMQAIFSKQKHGAFA